ncbi:hypothetical protein [Bradyrhizobium arachidis]|uniref:TIGR04255 family protein n=1 Tax=Bradyrhizobium arachidis TaxID=858423 RepID=A0AAE7NMZ0_9BRAD|nr:hypothetical protein [Bradyrhizobium arachidis]QOZ67145.1 hypothetical protein WN72_13090 [Bradyrhizobium arachidis]SFV15966.1 TIGR04255 family protein [Bradyrhizobium arachidis]
MTSLPDLDWKPFNDTHSIEVVAASVNFLEPLTEVAWKKAVREAEAVCRAAGLNEKQVVNSLQFMVGPNQVPQTSAGAPTVEAMIFQRSAAVTIPGAGIQKRPLESLQIGRFGVIYQAMSYTAWEAFATRLEQLVRAPLRSALFSVGVANLRLEYKDNFRFAGAGKPVARALLNSESTLIVPHVFDNERLWHSHTGFFEAADGCKERLIQINIDANEMLAADQMNKPFRAISITTAVQNNLAETSSEALENEAELATSQLSMFGSMHDRSIGLFKEIVSADIAARVGLHS